MIRIHGNPGANHGKLQSTLLLQEFEITKTNDKRAFKKNKNAAIPKTWWMVVFSYILIIFLTQHSHSELLHS